MIEIMTAIQRDLNRLEEWAARNLINSIRINAKSCTWEGRSPCNDRLGPDWLGSRSAEKNLRVLVDGKLGMSQQCAATRAVLSMARRSRGMAAPLYLALILPRLQHCVWFWAPLFKKDINK